METALVNRVHLFFTLQHVPLLFQVYHDSWQLQWRTG